MKRLVRGGWRLEVPLEIELAVESVAAGVVARAAGMAGRGRDEAEAVAALRANLCEAWGRVVCAEDAGLPRYESTAKARLLRLVRVGELWVDLGGAAGRCG